MRGACLYTFPLKIIVLLRDTSIVKTGCDWSMNDRRAPFFFCAYRSVSHSRYTFYPLEAFRIPFAGR